MAIKRQFLVQDWLLVTATVTATAANYGERWRTLADEMFFSSSNSFVPKDLVILHFILLAMGIVFLRWLGRSSLDSCVMSDRWTKRDHMPNRGRRTPRLPRMAGRAKELRRDPAVRKRTLVSKDRYLFLFPKRGQGGGYPYLTPQGGMGMAERAAAVCA